MKNKQKGGCDALVNRKRRKQMIGDYGRQGMDDLWL